MSRHANRRRSRRGLGVAVRDVLDGLRDNGLRGLERGQRLAVTLTVTIALVVAGVVLVSLIRGVGFGDDAAAGDDASGQRRQDAAMGQAASAAGQGLITSVAQDRDEGLVTFVTDSGRGAVEEEIVQWSASFVAEQASQEQVPSDAATTTDATAEPTAAPTTEPAGRTVTSRSLGYRIAPGDDSRTVVVWSQMTMRGPDGPLATWWITSELVMVPDGDDWLVESMTRLQAGPRPGDPAAENFVEVDRDQ